VQITVVNCFPPAGSVVGSPPAGGTSTGPIFGGGGGVPIHQLLDISHSNIIDPLATNTVSPYYQLQCTFSLESTTDMKAWTTCATATNWISQASCYTVWYDTNGVQVLNPIVIGKEPCRFFRLHE
jgi:hypothetical protein